MNPLTRLKVYWLLSWLTFTTNLMWWQRSVWPSYASSTEEYSNYAAGNFWYHLNKDYYNWKFLLPWLT